MRGIKSFAMVLCVRVHFSVRSATLLNNICSRPLQKTAKMEVSNSSGHQKTLKLATKSTSRALTTKVRTNLSAADTRNLIAHSLALGATPLSQLNPKKKIFETIQPGFTTLDTHEAAWINPATKSVHRIRTKDGVCVAPSFIGASLS